MLRYYRNLFHVGEDFSTSVLRNDSSTQASTSQSPRAWENMHAVPERTIVPLESSTSTVLDEQRSLTVSSTSGSTVPRVIGDQRLDAEDIDALFQLFVAFQ